MPGGSGQIYTTTQSNLGFNVRYDQLLALDPIVCSNWICRAAPGRFTLQTQPNLELAIFKLSNCHAHIQIFMSSFLVMFHVKSCQVHVHI